MKICINMDNKAKTLINACKKLGVNYCLNSSSSIYDIMDTEKPDIVLNYSQRLVEGLPEFPGVTFISQTPYLVDVTIYKELEVDSRFAVDLLGWDESGLPDIDMKEFASLDGRSKRLFSPRKRSGPCYCGFVDENLYATIISSASRVITFDEKSFLNAVHCNGNVEFSGESEIEIMTNLDYITGLIQ